MKRDGLDGDVPALAAKAAAAMVPASHDDRLDRLTMLGMAMASGKDDAQAAAWLHLNTRLLADLPSDILAEALDEIALASTFLPSTAEIRAKADPKLEDRRRKTARLDALARLIASGVDVPPARPTPLFEEPEPFREEDRCKPEEAAAILAEMGLKGSAGESIMRHVGPPRAPTAEELQELSKSLQRRAA